jgi:hypothetical protein
MFTVGVLSTRRDSGKECLMAEQREGDIDLQEKLAELEDKEPSNVKGAMYLVGKATGVLASIPAGMYEWHNGRNDK